MVLTSLPAELLLAIVLVGGPTVIPSLLLTCKYIKNWLVTWFPYPWQPDIALSEAMSHGLPMVNNVLALMPNHFEGYTPWPDDIATIRDTPTFDWCNFEAHVCGIDIVNAIYHRNRPLLNFIIERGQLSKKWTLACTLHLCGVVDDPTYPLDLLQKIVRAHPSLRKDTSLVNKLLQTKNTTLFASLNINVRDAKVQKVFWRRFDPEMMNWLKKRTRLDPGLAASYIPKCGVEALVWFQESFGGRNLGITLDMKNIPETRALIVQDPFHR